VKFHATGSGRKTASSFEEEYPEEFRQLAPPDLTGLTGRRRSPRDRQEQGCWP
jgi:hypothetical protein